MGYADEHDIKAICFDIDGTFYRKWRMDIRLLRASLFHIPFAMKYNRLRQKIREEDGYDEKPVMSYAEISRRGAAFFYNDESGESQKRFREKEKRVFHDSYLRSYRRIKRAENVEDALSLAKERGLKLACLSDFPIGVKLKTMGIEKYFDAVLSSEDIGHFKPSKTPFMLLASSLGIPTSSILYVGDSYRKDVLGAVNAGMKACLIFSNSVNKYKRADLVLPSWKKFIEKVL